MEQGILLVNLGSPAAPTADAVADWLIEFLSDPYVVELPRLLWVPLLKWVIAPRRAPIVAELYQSIWSTRGSPLVTISQCQAQALQQHLSDQGHQVKVVSAMRYGNPSIASEIENLRQQCERVQVMLQYPQFANSTSLSSSKLIEQIIGNDPSVKIIDCYPVHPGYVQALKTTIESHWQDHGRGEHLLISFHGLPERSIRRGDPYQDHCEQTTVALVKALNLKPTDYTLSYQSRFGRARWIGPSTTDSTAELANSGIKQLDVVCPGFSADCLETLEEISVQLKAQFLADGGEQFRYIAALNDSTPWIEAMADMLLPPLLEQ
ncbi:MAG: ferrochelatase [Immundisolibacteraceae bacterium]|nr:ferrochelatase [Immundisolibacteraceae bacterium]